MQNTLCLPEFRREQFSAPRIGVLGTCNDLLAAVWKRLKKGGAFRAYEIRL
jgi:hypothetical protein